jgi:hypothetical protein
MSKLHPWQSGTAVFLALGLSVGLVAPMVAPAPSFAQNSTFSDVSSNHWASNFISELARREIIAGFPDGNFNPDAPVTRSQFAAMLRKANQAFKKSSKRNAISFADVPSSYWAYSAIQDAYTSGFMAGYPGNIFRPEQNIPREQVLVSLANGLGYVANSTNVVSYYYDDSSSISSYAVSPIAAATEKQMVVNYPNLRSLNPQRNATRAEVAALIYQALVSEGQATMISSQYIVGTTPIATDFTIPAGITIPVKYVKEKILMAQEDEKLPITLIVEPSVTTSNGMVLIPAGSEIVGELRTIPNQKGVQFVAQTIKINDKETAIDASSQVITTMETVSQGSTVVTLVRNAAIGAAAAAAIAAVTGDQAIATEEVLIGGGAGLVVGLIQRFVGRNSVDLYVVQPDTDLDLKLNSNLVITSK